MPWYLPVVGFELGHGHITCELWLRPFWALSLSWASANKPRHKLLDSSQEQCPQLGFRGDNLECQVSLDFCTLSSNLKEWMSTLHLSRPFPWDVSLPFLMWGYVISCVSSPHGEAWYFGALFHVLSLFELMHFSKFSPKRMIWKDVILPPWPLSCIVRDVFRSLNSLSTLPSPFFYGCPKLVWMCEWGF